MPTRLTLLFLLVVLIAAAVLAPGARAESADCTTPVLIIADGRITQSTFPQNTTYWYGIFTTAGHSYSVEFEPPADNYLNASKVQFSPLVVFSPADSLSACRGTSSLTVTQNSGYAPVILKSGNGAGRRLSFTAQIAGLHLIAVTNLAGNGNYSFRAIDTTMMNPRWSTCAGFDNQWGFQNLSDMPITGVFTLYDLSNRALVAVQFTIPPGGEAVRYSGGSDLNLPRNTSGYVIFSHNGPPGSILADAYMINGPATVVVPTKFEAALNQ